ncbi:MAG: hypothetical protein JO165_02570 [Candidatus Eremiobacteraeota bacterium]|nr:hypothetical protein [Candidatus Eremiobacteraeota bacterium]
MQWNWLYFGLGAVGGAAPEIVRLYALRTTPEKFQWSAFYLIISLFFVALAGLVAVILPSVTPWGAFYAGIALPVIVTTVAKKAAQSDGDQAKGVRNNNAAAPPPSIHSYFKAL